MGFFSAALWIKLSAGHMPITDVAAVPWGSLAVTFGFYFIFLALLVVITFVDLDHYLIPHEFTLPGIVVGILAAVILNSNLLTAGALSGFWPPVTLSSALIGLVAGALAVIMIYYLYFAARGVEGLGGGDVTMMALIGVWLGWPALIFVFFAASIQGLIAAAIGALFGASFLKDSGEILAAEDPRVVATERRRNEQGSIEEPEPDTDPEPESEPDTEPDTEPEPDPEPEPEPDSDPEPDTDPEPDAETEPGPESGGLAIPFGPFLALSAAEFFFLGEFMPEWISLSYLYLGL